MRYSKQIDLFEMRIDYMLHAIYKLDDYMKGVTEKQFCDNGLLIDAVSKNIENIGEHANKMDNKGPTYQLSLIYNQIKWRKYSAIRHLLVHQYEDILPCDLYEFYKNHIPHLKHRLLDIKDEIKSGKTLNQLMRRKSK